MILRELLGRLDGVRTVRGGYLARCPAHEDRNPSLSVSDKNGRILLHCHAGCTVEAIVSALGLTMTDLFTESTSNGESASGYRKLVTVAELAAAKKLPVEFLKGLGLQDSAEGVVISYHLADGCSASRHRVRSHLEHVRGWCWWTGKDGAIVPYGLNHLTDAQKARYIVLVEGESDLWTLAYYGFPALGIPGAEMCKTLGGDHLQGIPKIFILQEADAGGSTFLAGVNRRLQEIGWTGETRVVSLAPLKDVNELHCADPQRFKAAFQAALDSAERPAKAANVNGFTLTPLGELLAKPDAPVDYVLDGCLVAGTVSGVFAKPKVGKGTLSRNLCLAVSRGVEFLELATKQGECIYLALEEREDDVKRDFRAMGADGTEPILIHASAAPAEGVYALCDLVRQRKPRLVVIDPIIRLARIRDEKAYAETYNALGPLIDAARESGTHVMLLHHSGKAVKTDAIDSPLGSTAIGGAVSTLILLKRTEAYRTIQTRQRIGQDLPETVLQFNPETKRLFIGGTRFEADRRECEGDILEFLKACGEPQTQAQIRDGVEGHQTRVTRAALTALAEAGKVAKSGEGTKGKPFFYEFQNSGSQYIPGTSEPEFEKPAQTRLNTGDILVPETSEKPILVLENLCPPRLTPSARERALRDPIVQAFLKELDCEIVHVEDLRPVCGVI